MDNMIEELGKIIKKELKRRKMTYAELAEGICAPSVICDIVNGDKTNLTLKVLNPILERLEVPMQTVMSKVTDADNYYLYFETKIFNSLLNYNCDYVTKTVFDTDCKNKEALLAICQSYALQKQDKYEEALKEIEKAMKLAPNNELNLIGSFMNYTYLFVKMHIDCKNNRMGDKEFEEKTDLFANQTEALLSTSPELGCRFLIYSLDFHRHIGNNEAFEAVFARATAIVQKGRHIELLPQYLTVKIAKDFLDDRIEDAVSTSIILMNMLRLSNGIEQMKSVEKLIKAIAGYSSEFKDKYERQNMLYSR